jgi:hypothetical protein
VQLQDAIAVGCALVALPFPAIMRSPAGNGLTLAPFLAPVK